MECGLGVECWTEVSILGPAASIAALYFRRTEVNSERTAFSL